MKNNNEEMRMGRKEFFMQALPVWEKGKDQEMNYFLRFEASLESDTGVLKVAACNVYRLFVNGIFAAAGPARAAHDFYRVDEIVLDGYLNKGCNDIVVEVGAYRVNSFSDLDAPGFLQCEIISGGEVAAATGVCGFVASRMSEKVRKVQRYSFQRTFCEEYCLPAKDRREYVELEILPERNLLERGVAYCKYEREEIADVIAYGRVVPHQKREHYYWDRCVSGISERFKGYKIDELESFVSKDVEDMDFIYEKKDSSSVSGELIPDTCRIYSIGRLVTGLLCAKIDVKSQCTVYFIFDEILKDGDVDYKRLTCANVVKYSLSPGVYELQTFEPYTMQYVKIVCLGGTCTVSDLHIRQIRMPYEKELPVFEDEVLQKIYTAAVETFCQNSVDIYMDCPSRERAGWLCDSFFTARTEYALTGECKIERNFLENYLLPERFADIPQGMLPMCYPSDHTDRGFIPNWAMWFVLELEEYYERSREDEFILRARKRIYDLLAYFEQFENEDGLLENLKGWIFVEWSKCNSLVDGINYPSNMLYAKMLEVVYRLYADERCLEKAEKIRAAIRNQAYNGTFFREHANRVNGDVVVREDVTETCQYYAFFMGTATPQMYPELWNTLKNSFGPGRKQNNQYESVWFSNAFIGNYLRLCLLKQYGEQELLLKEIKEYFLYMAEKTGTLWEHDAETASCNHGFASYVVCLLDKNDMFFS